MITAAEIKAKARQYSLPVSTVERDYAQGWLLSKLGAIDMTFKGGTALKEIYFGDTYRFSDDLDFTLLSDFSTEAILDIVKTALISVRNESGIAFEDAVEYDKSASGYVIYTKFRIVNASGPAIKIKLDISTRETEIILGPHEKARIIHNYSDKLQSEIKAYSIDEIMAEKIRLCFQRTRPRDIYDIFYLNEKISKPAVEAMLEKKFVFKRATPDLQRFIGRKTAYEAAWQNSIRHQVNPVPEFDRVFSDVFSTIKKFRFISSYTADK